MRDFRDPVAGVWLMSAAMIGYLLRPMAVAVRVLVFAAGVLLLIPSAISPFGLGHWINGVGAMLALALIGWEYQARGRGPLERPAG